MSTPKLYDVPPDAKFIPCRGCGKRIAWGVTENGKRVPLSVDSEHAQRCGGIVALAPSHFLDCSEASSFSKRKAPPQ